MTQNLDGGASIVKWLKGAGVRNVFSVSGGPINPVYRACAEFDLPLVHTRHEAAACYMAEAESRMTGRAGAVVVTLGPGATNTVTPALVSMMAGTPLIIIAAQAATGSFEKGAGMSYDPLPIMQSVTKWSARVLDADRIAEYLDIAWRKMWAGRPGPVFLEVPSDIMAAQLTRVTGDTGPDGPPERALPAASEADADRLRGELAAAKRPLVLLGEEIFWDAEADWQKVIEHHNMPFAALRLARGVVDEAHPLCMGPGYNPCNETLRTAMGEADRIFLIGHHFEFDLEFGNKLGVGTRVVQIASDPELLHRNRRADVAVAAAPSMVAAVLLEADPAPVDREWVNNTLAAWRQEWEAQLGDDDADSGAMHPIAAVDVVTEAAPAETVYVTSHGNVDFWADARLRPAKMGRYLRAGQSGALGAEVPYGAGAAFAAPGTPSIVFVGDGGVGFHATELDTAERYGRPFIIVVLDDACWGAIALPQKMTYGTTYQMDLPRKDWAKVAEGLGCKGYVCTSRDELRIAIGDALASGKPALVQVSVRSVISPYMNYIS